MGPEQINQIGQFKFSHLMFLYLFPGGEFLLLNPIPLEARITALADVFDALCSRRAYKEPWPVDKIMELLVEAGFKDFRCVDQNVTTLDEQRSTDWMSFHSLENFLDPDVLSLTIEGYPAPKRGIFIASR